MKIKGNRLLTALLLAVLLVTALLPAVAEDAPEAGGTAAKTTAASADRLYAAIDKDGYAYATLLQPNDTRTVYLYSDAALSADSLIGENKVSAKVLATEYTEDGVVHIWLMRAGRVQSVYTQRDWLAKAPVSEAQHIKSSQNTGKTPVEVEGREVYLDAAIIRPLADSDLAQWWEDIKFDFYLNFIHGGRGRWLLTGLGMTMLLTIGALLIGIVLGVLMAVVRSVWDTNGAKMQPGVGKLFLGLANGFFKAYTTVFRGTPMMVQLLIMGYVIFVGFPSFEVTVLGLKLNKAVMVATLSFGLNSGAYVAEIFRGGIMSIDKGQMEAGRSIGMSYGQTMWHIIAPQVIKNVLPTLCNEFITLIKETSIAFNLGVSELTNAGDRIRGQTYSPFMPLIAVALIYLVIVVILTKLVGILERRLRQSDAR